MRKAGSYKAVLFDFDGVLARTAEDNCRAWEKVLSKHGVPFDRDEYLLLEGMTTKGIAGKLLERRPGLAGLAGAVAALKDEYYGADNRFAMYEGVGRVLGFLRAKKILLGVVSGAGRRRLECSAGSDFLAGFDAVVTGDDVSSCKPDPEPYLKAAKKLALSVSDCLVVENAPLGIEAAARAGMDCVAVCSTLARSRLGGADRVIDRLDELLTVLR